jgi:transposase
VPSKLYDVEMSLRGVLRGFGLNVGPTSGQRRWHAWTRASANW